MRFRSHGTTERLPIRIRRIVQSSETLQGDAVAGSVTAFRAFPYIALTPKLLSHVERVLEQRAPYNLPQS